MWLERYLKCKSIFKQANGLQLRGEPYFRFEIFILFYRMISKHGFCLILY